jgi:DNA-binding CsgD family transcriptional regulator
MVRAREEVFGREPELAAVEAFLTSRQETRALLLVGEPGAGKTVLLRSGVEMARAADYQVLACRPTGAETKLAYAALGDLLNKLRDDVVPRLPRPQRAALEVALLLRESSGPPPDPRAIGRACLSSLQLAAQTQPIAIAIDDVQWLDQESADAVGFALRRLESESVAVVATVRGDGERPTPLGLDEALGERLQRLPVGPLSPGALQQLIATRLGVELTRPMLSRIVEASAGNPFYALELARGLARRGALDVPSGGPPPLPESLQALLRERLALMPDDVHEVLLAAAAAREPTHSLLAEVAPGASLALAEAARLELVELEGEFVRFSHPLFASALYGEADAHQRKALHEQLAAAMTNPEERARHLALAASGPDAEAAGALESAAAQAWARGAPTAAAELADDAVRLTPGAGGPALRRRRLGHATYLMAAGDAPGARALVQREIAATPAGAERASLCVLLAPWGVDDIPGTIEMLRTAVTDAAEDHALTAQVLVWLSAYEGVMAGDLGSGRRHALAALESAQRSGVDEVLAPVLVSLGRIEVLIGLPARDHLERASELGKASHAPLPHERPEFWLGEADLFAGRVQSAREPLEAAYREAKERDDSFARHHACMELARLEWFAGDWSRASALAQENYDVAIEAGVHLEGAVVYPAALLAASQGDVERARALTGAAIRASTAQGEHLFLAFNRWILGFLELSLGDAREATRTFDELTDDRARWGAGDPGMPPFWGDAIESVIELGDYDRADCLISALEAEAAGTDHPWRDAVAARCRGLLRSAAGDHESALESVSDSLARFAELGLPFEHARSVLTLGTVERRMKHKRSARESLEVATAVFADLGAPLWAAKTSAELKRIGGRTSGGDELTETEWQVAELVAQGRSNRDVAAELFVAVRTVEWNLTKIYAKLGVRSRSELARKLTLEQRP